MAVVAITGVMGAGKTYLAVRDKLIPFLEEGRTVVTSIAIADSCYPVIANYLGIPLAELRERLIVRDNAALVELLQKKKLFFHQTRAPDGLVKPGFVFMPDEAWALAKKGRNTYDEEFEEFVKMHRHYKDAQGRTVEIVLITQSLRQLNSDLTDVVELELKCKKQKALGKPEAFTVAYHEGGNRKPSHYYEYRYDKKIFPLYKSHDGEGAQAVEHYDKSMSIFNRPIFKFLKFGLLPLFVLALWFGYGAFGKLTSGKALKGAVDTAAQEIPGTRGAAGAEGPATATGAQTGARPASPAGAGGSTWRIVASYTVGGLPVYEVVDEKGRYRTVTPGSVARGAGDDVTITVGKEADLAADAATPWTNTATTYTGRASTGVK